MKSRTFFVIMGMVLVASGLAGVVLYEKDQRKQEEELKASAADEQRKMEEEQKRAEALKDLLDAEKQRAQQVENKRVALEESRRMEMEDEKARQNREVERRAVRKKEEEQRSRGDNGKVTGRREPDRVRAAEGVKKGKGSSGSMQASREKPQAPTIRQVQGGGRQGGSGKTARRVTVIRVSLDPSRTREMRLARVHAGDRVSIKVLRMDGARDDLYLGMTPLSASFRAWPDSTEWYPGSSPFSLLTTTIRDKDHLRIESEPGFGSRVGMAVESRDGVILNIGVGKARKCTAGKAVCGRRGSYRIEITIYEENPWNITPRSLV